MGYSVVDRYGMAQVSELSLLEYVNILYEWPVELLEGHKCTIFRHEWSEILNKVSCHISTRVSKMEFSFSRAYLYTTNCKKMLFGNSQFPCMVSYGFIGHKYVLICMYILSTC